VACTQGHNKKFLYSRCLEVVVAVPEAAEPAEAEPAEAVEPAKAAEPAKAVEPAVLEN
jgi:hypothetical protein